MNIPSYFCYISWCIYFVLRLYSYFSLPILPKGTDLKGISITNNYFKIFNDIEKIKFHINFIIDEIILGIYKNHTTQIFFKCIRNVLIIIIHGICCYYLIHLYCLVTGKCPAKIAHFSNPYKEQIIQIFDNNK